ncbi:protease modulator HflC [bacterium]|nr:protease modulator HflC [bacterium]
MWRKVLKFSFIAMVLVAAYTSIVMVDESEAVIVERFGRITAVYDTAELRGLHFKAPWPVDVVRRFDRRVRVFDPPGRELFTSDRKNVTVDPFVCWKIAEPSADTTAINDRPVVRFFRSLSNSANAEARIDSQLRSVLTTEFGGVELDGLLNVTDSTTGPQDGAGSIERLSTAIRSGLADEIRADMGLQIVDARIKRINFPMGNQQAVFERMKSERRKIADRYRSAGLAENQVIKSTADRQYNELIARAKGTAEQIRGEAEAKAIQLLSEAHARDPEFYEIMRTLDSYKAILGQRTTLVLSASGKLFQLLTNGLPDEQQQPHQQPVPTGTAPKPIDVTDATSEKTK